MSPLALFGQFLGWSALFCLGYWLAKELRNPMHLDENNNLISHEEYERRKKNN